MPRLDARLTRRKFLGLTAAAIGAGAGLGVARCDPRILEPHVNGDIAGRPSDRPPLSWVWQFSADGHPAAIRNALASRNAGIVLKTHDGHDYMRKYDSSIYGIFNAAQAQVMAEYFEERNVPFHAWCVARGFDPVLEATIGADVLAAGARSLFIDFEPHAGFWAGDANAAKTLGQELRRRAPGARIWLSIDPRPWQLRKLPMNEIVPYVDGFAPQIYWETFADNGVKYAQSGFDPGPSGITPEFLLEVTYQILKDYGLPIAPVGQGASADQDAWRRFLGYCATLETDEPSVWRFGVTPEPVWDIVLDPKARTPLPRLDLESLARPTPTPTATPDLSPTQQWPRR